MANFAGFGNAFQGASAVTDALQKQEDARRTLQGQAMLSKILQQYAGGNGAAPAPQPGPAAGMAMQAPTDPGALPVGGVSPSPAGMPPAGSAPGGAGPISPQGGALPSGMAMQPNAPVGLDMQKLVQAVAAQGGSPGSQGAALQQLMKLIQPQANNAVKLDIATGHDATSKENTGKRGQVSERNTDAKINAADKSKPTDQLLKEFTSQGNVIARMPPDNPAYPAELAKFDSLQAEIDERRKKAGLPPGKGALPLSTPASGEGQPVPEEYKNDPDGTTYNDAAGVVHVKQGDYLVPQKK